MKATSSVESVLQVTINSTDEQEGKILADTASARVLHRWIVENTLVPNTLLHSEV